MRTRPAPTVSAERIAPSRAMLQDNESQPKPQGLIDEEGSEGENVACRMACQASRNDARHTRSCGRHLFHYRLWSYTGFIGKDSTNTAGSSPLFGTLDTELGSINANQQAGFPLRCSSSTGPASSRSGGKFHNFYMSSMKYFLKTSVRPE